MPRLDVVDLSHHNTVNNFEQMFQAGVLGVIHKASQGTSFVDEDYFERRSSAFAAGLQWASYHFLEHGDIESQVRHYLTVAAPEKGERVVIDYEHADLILSDLEEAVKLIWELDSSLQVTVYGGHLLKEQLGARYNETLAETSLWIAQYTTGQVAWPDGTWPFWTLWQYTDGDYGSPGTIPGTISPIDRNNFNGSRDNCKAWFGPAVPGPSPEPEPTPVPEVNFSVEVKGTVKVSVTVNGDIWFPPTQDS